MSQHPANNDQENLLTFIVDLFKEQNKKLDDLDSKLDAIKAKVDTHEHHFNLVKWGLCGGFVSIVVLIRSFFN